MFTILPKPLRLKRRGFVVARWATLPMAGVVNGLMGLIDIREFRETNEIRDISEISAVREIIPYSFLTVTKYRYYSASIKIYFLSLLYYFEIISTS